MKTKSPDVHHRRSPSDVMMSNAELAVSCASQLSKLSPKPFFIMDWLEEVSPRDLERAQKLLQGENYHRDVFHPSTRKEVDQCPGKECTSIYQRSVAIGNGFNAKGIEQARQGVWNEALLLWENALDVRLCVLGEGHVDVANTFNNIGIAKGKLGFHDEALDSLQKALEIRKDYFGVVHPQVAATMHNIGNVHQQNGELEAALQCFCECKLQQEQILGSSNHAEVARACIAIGHCYYEADAFVDAREAYLDALSIFRSVGLPEAHSEVITTVEDIFELDQRILALSPQATTH